MRFEVVDGLNFPVGGNQTPDRPLLDDSGSHWNPVIAVRDESGRQDYRPKDGKRRYPPTPRLASRTVSIQCHTEKSASFNVYHPSAAEQSVYAWPYLFGCSAPAVCGTGYNRLMPKSPRSMTPRYTEEHASAGLDHDFPEIETWANQFPASGQSGYEIVVEDPEFTSVCPKTGLPDFGNIVIRYEPDRLCLELKSLKEYLQAYRNLGIFQENIVNRVLEDIVRWAKPVWAEVKGEFRPRGGISTVVIARWPRRKGQK